MLKGSANVPVIAGLDLTTIGPKYGFANNGLWIPPNSIDAGDETEDWSGGTQNADSVSLGPASGWDTLSLNYTNIDAVDRQCLGIGLANLVDGPDDESYSDFYLGNAKYIIYHKGHASYGNGMRIFGVPNTTQRAWVPGLDWMDSGQRHTFVIVDTRVYLDGVHKATFPGAFDWDASSIIYYVRKYQEHTVRRIVHYDRRATAVSDGDADAMAAELHALLVA
jgi:hypothetical protein